MFPDDLYWQFRENKMTELSQLETEVRKLRRMVIEAHEACVAENMPCPWCEGHIWGPPDPCYECNTVHKNEKHDECCPWPGVKEKWTEHGLAK